MDRPPGRRRDNLCCSGGLGNPPNPTIRDFAAYVDRVPAVGRQQAVALDKIPVIGSPVLRADGSPIPSLVAPNRGQQGWRRLAPDARV